MKWPVFKVVSDSIFFFFFFGGGVVGFSKCLLNVFSKVSRVFKLALECFLAFLGFSSWLWSVFLGF